MHERAGFFIKNLREQDFLLKTLVNGIITLCLYISQLFPYEIFLVFKPALLPDQ
jgi:hypothetical protein